MRVRLHVWLAIAVLAFGVYLRAANLGGPAFCCDEFYDVFAARSWLAGEGLKVPGREYTRARLNVYLTAGAFRLFGESEAAARIPPLFFGIATMGLAYAAGRLLFGRVAALVALAVVAISPDAVDVSRFVRLYSPLAFFTLLAALAAYRALEGRDEGFRVSPARAGWLLLAGVSALVAAHLHPIALALGPSILAYAAIRAGALGLGRKGAEARRYACLAAALALLGGTALLVPAVRGHVADAVSTPLPWYRPAPGDGWTYHAHLTAGYAWLWFLVWPATAVAVLARPRPGLFVACAFWVPFLVLSALVATKQPRYAVHVLPFAWLLLGGAAEAIWPRARAAILARTERFLPPRFRSDARVHAIVPAAVVAVALLPLVRLTPAAIEAVRRHTETTGRFTTGHYQEWRDLAARLSPRLPPDARIVSTTWHAPIYYLHRSTNHLLPAFRRRGEGDWETPDRSAAGQVQTADDLARLLEQGRPIWVLSRRTSWDRDDYLDERLKRTVERECRREALPPQATFAAFDCGPRDRQSVLEVRRAGAVRQRPCRADGVYRASGNVQRELQR